MRFRIVFYNFFLAALLLLMQNVSSFAQESDVGSDDEMTEEEFKSKLSDMFNRLNKSIKIIRDQITENQSAPFLANLYMQLGDMLSQKANVLYYIKMETTKGEAASEEGDKKFKDVVDATKEAISIYEKVLKEFPKFVGRSRAMYQLSSSLKSIDESQKFLVAVNDLIKNYRETKDGAKGQLLLGQHTFERGIFDEALKIYLPLKNIPFAYERNQAKYKIGLIHLADGKHKQALDSFVEVITDKEFKDEDNEAEVNLKKKNVRADLKREALIDSVRAFTEVFKENPDAVKFYSNIAPTENLFQEVIEKLAFRYINLKQYNNAIRLLRTLTERTASPEKVLTIYKEVLLMIPLNDRITLPVSEIRYVLEKYVQWITFYKLPADVNRSADDFFEKQLRDLGTRSHEMGKSEKDPKKAGQFLQNSINFYELYLALFRQTKFTMKMALNTGDANFRIADYMKCGDYYLRAFKGEWGKVADKSKAAIIKNAVYCLQKEKEYSFYELRRVKGLLIESLKLLMELDPSKKQDPQTNFALAKAIYDQGFYQPALPRLLDFMKKFPSTKFAVDAANLILDYFNIKSDYQGLMDWGGKILALNLPNEELNTKVKAIREQAKYKKLQAQVESSSSFDGFAQGKSYLANAANIQNVELRNLALSKALEASKREKDTDTFFKAAKSIAAKEPDATKRAEIELSMAQEHAKMSNFSDAKSFYQKIVSQSGYGKDFQTRAFNELVTMSLALRDWDSIAKLVVNPLWSQTSQQSKQQLSDLAGNALESNVRATSSMTTVIRRLPASASLALGVWKAGFSNGSLSSLKNSIVSSQCSSNPSSAVCRWNSLAGIDKQANAVNSSLGSASGDLTKMETLANQFAGMIQAYSQLEGGEDPAVDVVTSLRQSELYGRFGLYLRKVAQANAEIAQVLMAKSQESLKTATAFKQRCKKIIQSSGLLSPVNRSCLSGQNNSLTEIFSSASSTTSPSIKHVSSAEHMPLKKNVFSVYEANSVLKLASAHLNQGAYHYSAAVSMYGLSLGVSQGDFNTLLGCSVMHLGYVSEASYYLKNGSDFEGLQSKCQSRLKSLVKQ
jgi:tetratricopeptide (TPR) repeat protein